MLSISLLQRSLLGDVIIDASPEVDERKSESVSALGDALLSDQLTLGQVVVRGPFSLSCVVNEGVGKIVRLLRPYLGRREEVRSIGLSGELSLELLGNFSHLFPVEIRERLAEVRLVEHHDGVPESV